MDLLLKYMYIYVFLLFKRAPTIALLILARSPTSREPAALAAALAAAPEQRLLPAAPSPSAGVRFTQ